MQKTVEYQICTFAKGLNKMKKLLTSLAITALVALPVAAQESGSHAVCGASAAGGASGGAAGGAAGAGAAERLVQQSVVSQQQL